MNVETVHSDKAFVLTLKGSWTIERAHELKNALKDALNADDSIIIQMDQTAEVDLSCLQLLCSAHRTSLRRDKHLAFHEERSAAFKRVVREAGFVRTLGCHGDPHKSCLWKGGGES